MSFGPNSVNLVRKKLTRHSRNQTSVGGKNLLHFVENFTGKRLLEGIDSNIGLNARQRLVGHEEPIVHGL